MVFYAVLQCRHVAAFREHNIDGEALAMLEARHLSVHARARARARTHRHTPAHVRTHPPCAHARAHTHARSQTYARTQVLHVEHERERARLLSDISRLVGERSADCRDEIGLCGSSVAVRLRCVQLAVQRSVLRLQGGADLGATATAASLPQRLMLVRAVDAYAGASPVPRRAAGTALPCCAARGIMRRGVVAGGQASSSTRSVLR
jgi:hypothetical protein